MTGAVLIPIAFFHHWKARIRYTVIISLTAISVILLVFVAGDFIKHNSKSQVSQYFVGYFVLGFLAFATGATLIPIAIGVHWKKGILFGVLIPTASIGGMILLFNAYLLLCESISWSLGVHHL